MIAYWWVFIGGVIVIILVLSFVKPFQKRASFAHKNVIITGASAGIGRDLAILIAKENVNSITILARTQARLDEVATELKKTCNNVLAISCDVTNRDSVKQSIDESVTRFGIPDFLITCAGLATPGYFLEQDLNIAEYTMQVDFFGTLYASQHVALHMTTKGSGHIVMISSACAALGLVGYSSYCPAKYAVKGLAETLRQELAPHNIRISLAYPPDTLTPGYTRENLTKPADTLEISAMGSVSSSEYVASSIIAGIKKGDFHIAMDFFTKVFVSLSNSISPRQYGLLEVIFFPLVALLGFVTRILNDSIVRKHYKLRKNKKY